MYREVDSVLSSRINLLKENKVSKLHHHYLLILRNNIRMLNNLRPKSLCVLDPHFARIFAGDLSGD